MIRRYATPLAFKTALDQRLRDKSEREGAPLRRLRQLVVFDRFLARVFAVLRGVVLKGGVVLELRLARARGTHEVPSALPPPPAGWTPIYARIAESDGLPWVTVEVLFNAVRAFLDPVLAGAPGDWSPDQWLWRASPPPPPPLTPHP